MGALDARTREAFLHTSRTTRRTDFVALPEEIDRRYGPKPGRDAKPVGLVLDNGPIHTSKLTTTALAARPWITVEWRPRDAPELNDIALAWCGLKRLRLAHKTFTGADHRDEPIHQAVNGLNRERAHPCDNLKITA